MGSSRPDGRHRSPAPRRSIVGLAIVLGALVPIAAACSAGTSSTTTSAPATSAPTTAPPTTRAPYQAPGTTAAPGVRTTRPATSSPATPGTEVDAAVLKAAPFLASKQADIDGPSMFVVSNVGLTYDVAELAALRQAAIDELAAEPPLSETIVYLTQPLYRRMVWRDAPVTKADIELIPTADWLSKSIWAWATAFACGTPAYPADWTAKVRAMMKDETNTGYIATHAAFGLASQLELGCTVEDEAALRDEIIANIQKHSIKTPFEPNDNALEAAVAFQVLGRSDLIQPDWVTATLAAQQPDGSWARRVNGKDVGDWHTTLLAIWFLEGVQHPERAGPFFT